MEETSFPQLTINSSQENSGASRNYTKCAKCRKDGKKCLPQSRLLGERCERCIRTGYPCGPAERAPRRRRASMATGNGGLPSEGSSSGSTVIARPSGLIPQSATRWMLGQGANFGHISNMKATNTAAQTLFTRCRLDIENSQKSESSLGQGTAGHSNHLSQALHKYIVARIQTLHNHQLYGISCSRHAPNTNRANDSPLLKVSESVDPDSGDFKTDICSANILTQSQPMSLYNYGHARNSVNELPVDYYHFTATAVQKLMASMPNEASINWTSPYHLQYHDTMAIAAPFPAAHVAYWNLDREAAFKIWSSSPTQKSMIDVLGRKFAHIVAEVGDSELLMRMSIEDLKNLGPDARGLSLLDLGVIGDSPLIVRTVIDKDLVQPPFIQAMQRAIILDRLSIATEHILPHLTSSCWNEVYEIASLAGLAGEKEFKDLQYRLQAISLQETTRQQALDSLNNLEFPSSYDELIFPEDDSFDFSKMSDRSSRPGDASIPELSFGSSQITIESEQSDYEVDSFDFRYGQQYSPS